jgi:hypothetical protein
MQYTCRRCIIRELIRRQAERRWGDALVAGEAGAEAAAATGYVDLYGRSAEAGLAPEQEGCVGRHGERDDHLFCLSRGHRYHIAATVGGRGIGLWR